MRGRDDDQRFVLGLALQVSVPLEIATMRTWTAEARLHHARGCAEVIASHGDDLQFGGRHCAEAFAALTRGLAVAAYQPGGWTSPACTFAPFRTSPVRASRRRPPAKRPPRGDRDFPTMLCSYIESLNTYLQTIFVEASL